MKKYTLEELIHLDKDELTAEDVSFVLRKTPNHIRTCAHQRPELLSFPVNIYGTRVRIPRIPFLRSMGVGI